MDRPKKRFYPFFVLLAGIFFGGLLIYFKVDPLSLFKKLSTQELISPVGLSSVTTGLLTPSSEKEKREVIGFLPYWTIKESANFRYNQLSQIIYMGITFDASGSIVEDLPGWTNLQTSRLKSILRLAKDKGAKTLLGIQCFNDSDMETILGSENVRKKVVDTTLELVKENGFSGANIDFEYSGFPSPVLEQEFTAFISELKEIFTREALGFLLSVDVHADSVVRTRIYEIKQLGGIADQIIVMGYDFRRADAGAAGPVAPLRPDPENAGHDLTSLLSVFYRLVPPRKLILAVPYYGYEWETVSENFGAATHSGSGAMATYKRTMALVEKKNLPVFWHEPTLTPWLVHKEGSRTKQIYFDNEKSLGLKYDLVNQAGFGGVAIWALGYDGTRPELWELLKEKFEKHE